MEEVETKGCSKCHLEKPLSCFYKKAKAKDGLCPSCKECESKKGAEIRARRKNRTEIPVVLFKICNDCGETLSGECFYSNKGKLDGLSSECKKCSKKHCKKLFIENSNRDTVLIPVGKRCSRCGAYSLQEGFSKCKGTSDGLATACKECCFDIQLKLRYGVNSEWFYTTLVKQGGCLICGLEYIAGVNRELFNVDHDHLTLKIRGILCNRCNLGLGHFKDSVAYLRGAIEYIDKWEASTVDILGRTLEECLVSNVSKNFVRGLRLTKEQIDYILNSQDNRCSICKQNFTSNRFTHLDHNHTTGVVRGYLCNTCNLGIGKMRESTYVMRTAIEYLNRSVF
jgi:hypothetical protein